MKLRNIFIAGLSVLALSGCNDYLEVDAPSKNLPQDVFTDARAMQRALNGVYASLLTSNMFGDKLINTFVRNSDVEYATNSSEYTSTNKYCRFDCDPDGGDLKSTWEDCYHAIELCNLFIEGAEASPAYTKENPDPEVVQMLGEVKAIRGIIYHELIWNWGDVPFSFNSSQTTETTIYPITDRIEILDRCIKDIAAIADDMKDPGELSERVERVSRQAAYGIIARLALTAGGYYLAPEGNTYGKMVRADNYEDYLKICREYADKVIQSNVHSLTKDYYQVFVDECNNIVASNDDPMFEIPFGKESTGNIGYIHGPKMDQYQGATPHPYGKSSGGAKLSAFYRFQYDEEDERRDFVNQLMTYSANDQGYEVTAKSHYNVYNGKWSKLWVNGGLGSITEGNTGINYPYLRYADVLLMFAEADVKLEGTVTPQAEECLAKVRDRAFRNTNPAKVYDYPTDPEGFLKAVLKERKFEFAGEGLRWRDLVRNNLYSAEIYWTFFRYLEKADPSGNLSEVSMRDFDGNDEGYDNMPDMIYCLTTTDNAFSQDFVKDGVVYAQKGQRIMPDNQFPNNDIKIVWMLNPYCRSNKMSPTFNEWQAAFPNIPKASWVKDNYQYSWDSDGNVKNEIRYSLRGYIYLNDLDQQRLIDGNGNEISVPMPDSSVSDEELVKQLPVVRYIVPIPRTTIARSQGKYENKYGY
ncbi:MAG: RagB/SusD family nutrient uptake outer membrane protein [Bacteroides sp.]|nr:RagB/SusD family nutrient uptake outer membrane protein [Bacteroides sp.]MBD5332489.1 RagB/SusD family nutrient uptake outer membrane protein [Bacteroides sp.]